MPEARIRPHLILLPACLLCVDPAKADDMPKRKPGLWEITMVARGREVPMPDIQQCTSAETDALMATNLAGIMGNKCDKPAIRTGEGAITVDVTCEIGGKTTATRAVITGDFDSAYTVAVTSRPAGDGTPPQTGADEPQMTMQARWTGPCKKGQRPGDIILPGGIKINVRRFGIETGAANRP